MRRSPTGLIVDLASIGHLRRMVDARTDAPRLWHMMVAGLHLRARNRARGPMPSGAEKFAEIAVVAAETLHRSGLLPGWPAAKRMLLGQDGRGPRIVPAPRTVTEPEAPRAIREWRGFHCADLRQNCLVGFARDRLAADFDAGLWRSAIERGGVPDPAGPGRGLRVRVVDFSADDRGGPKGVERPIFDLLSGDRHLALAPGPAGFGIMEDGPGGGIEAGSFRWLLCCYTSFPSRANMRAEGPLAAICGGLVRRGWPGWTFDRGPGRPRKSNLSAD